MADNYCRDIHSSIHIMCYGDEIKVQPCCLVGEVTPYNSEDFNSLFSTMRNDNKNNAPLNETLCRRCIHDEAHNRQSKRLAANMQWDDRIYDAVGPEYIEVTLDFTCNSACMICGPLHSSYWTKFADKSPMPLTNDFEVIQKSLDNFDLSILKKIQFKGGEPFLSSRNVLFLEYIKEHCDTSKINLMYHTNGTVQPSKRVLELFNEFKLVELYISIDDVEDAYEYQRFPTKWKSIEEQIETFYSTMPGNVMFKIEQTLSLLNIHRMHKLTDWFNNSIIRTNKSGDASYIVRHAAGGKFGLHRISKAHYQWLELHHPAVLDQIPKPAASDTVGEIVDFVTDQDNKRNMDISKYFPEFLSFYKSP